MWLKYCITKKNWKSVHLINKENILQVYYSKLERNPINGQRNQIYFWKNEVSSSII